LGKQAGHFHDQEILLSGKIFTYEQTAGDPFFVGNVKIIPFAQTLRLRNPWWTSWGLVWNRPASVLVVTADGQEQVLPVHDPTRLIQLTLLAAGFLWPALAWVVLRALRERRSQAEQTEPA
jgi:hypothetical protein